MRPHGRARADRHDPRAWAVCDKCGLLYNRVDLRFQYEWAGNRLVNQNMLICEPCYDVPQEQLRVIILPSDPEPIENPRPEEYSVNNNPVDTIGQNIGTMVQNAGVKAAFDSNTNKPFFLSAALWASTAGLTNTVGKNWTGLNPNNTNGITASRFIATAPNDAKFLASGPSVYAFQGANIIPAWTTLFTGTTAGTIGEVIDKIITPNTGYMFHQFALTGDGTSASIAQLQIYKT
jgi:hypothetical protein